MRKMHILGQNMFIMIPMGLGTHWTRAWAQMGPKAPGPDSGPKGPDRDPGPACAQKGLGPGPKRVQKGPGHDPGPNFIYFLFLKLEKIDCDTRSAEMSERMLVYRVWP